MKRCDGIPAIPRTFLHLTRSWFETASPSRHAERRRAPFVATRVRRKPSVCSALEISGLQSHQASNGTNPWGCSWSDSGYCKSLPDRPHAVVRSYRETVTAVTMRRTGLLGVPSPRYSYPSSYSDSRCCFCHGVSGELRRTRSYVRGASSSRALHRFIVGTTVHPTGSDYCLVAWGGQAAIYSRI